MRHLQAICIGVLLLWSVGLWGQEKQPQIYAGVARCKVCHEAKAMGNQYAVWAQSKHAKAYETLTTAEAAAVAKEWGLKSAANEAPECLTCHVTGYNNATAEFGKKFDKTEDIQCESCHGPGEYYRKQEIMCDKETAIAKGLIMPQPQDCLTCHNENSPRYKSFDYDKFYAQIKHQKNPDYECATPEDEEEEW